VLRFTPDAAEDAARWLFHPSQSIVRKVDGSLIVRFQAGGVRLHMGDDRQHRVTASTTVAQPPTQH
jgi:hypothetical protein